VASRYHSLIMRIAILMVCLLALASCETPGPGGPPTPSGPARPKAQKTPAHTLSSATKALVSQARSQTAAGEFATAAATIERALRIEPANPLLWIELGKVREAEGNHVQAEAMARKGLAMAGNDTRAQSAAWKVIAQSLRARGRTGEAREAEARAARPATQ